MARPKVTRDTILFVSGLLGIGYETLFDKSDRPSLLILFGGMIGLPAFLNKDERDKKNREEKGVDRDDSPTSQG